MFVMTCGVITCYTRVSGLRAVVVCPPLAFFAGERAGSGAHRARHLLGRGRESWSRWAARRRPPFTGTALVVVIALGRGYRPKVPEIPQLSNLREALKDAWPSRSQRADLWTRRR